MIEPMHLYPEEKKRMQEVEKQGLSVMTCNNWLCPFNNDGYCVEPTKGDICGIYGDEDFNKYLDVVYDENYSDDFRDSVRRVMIARWGKKEQRLIYADALKESIDEHVYLVNHGFNESEYGITQYGIHQIIDDAPTIDAIPIEWILNHERMPKDGKEVEFMKVIRCKDCKHRDEETANCTRFRKEWYVQSNSFCSWAEPKVTE